MSYAIRNIPQSVADLSLQHPISDQDELAISKTVSSTSKSTFLSNFYIKSGAVSSCVIQDVQSHTNLFQVTFLDLIDMVDYFPLL